MAPTPTARRRERPARPRCVVVSLGMGAIWTVMATGWGVRTKPTFFRGPIAAAILASLSLAGCESSAATSSTAEDLAELAERVGVLERKAEVDSAIRDYQTSAYLKPADREYDQLQTDLGTIAVAIEGVSAAANGSSVRLTLGNPMSATLFNMSATIEWGRVDQSGSPVGEPFSKDHKFERALPAGSWRTFTITLSDVPPTELGYVRVKNFAHQGIRLAIAN